MLVMMINECRSHWKNWLPVKYYMRVWVHRCVHQKVAIHVTFKCRSFNSSFFRREKTDTGLRVGNVIDQTVEIFRCVFPFHWWCDFIDIQLREIRFHWEIRRSASWIHFRLFAGDFYAVRNSSHSPSTGAANRSKHYI